MLHTYEALLQPDGRLQFLDLPSGEIGRARRVLVTFADESPSAVSALRDAALSEASLAEDWLREEEASAWAHLQAAR